MPDFELDHTKNEQAQITAVISGSTLQTAFSEMNHPIEGIRYFFDNHSDDLNNEADLNSLLSDIDMLYVLLNPSQNNEVTRMLKLLAQAKEIGILTVIISTMPSSCEDSSHEGIADKNNSLLKQYADCLVIIPSASGQEAQELEQGNNAIAIETVRAATELITRQGLIRIDFADVRTALTAMELATIGVGKGSGKNRAKEAIEQALKSPSFDIVGMTKANGILVNITSGIDLGIDEFEEIGRVVKSISPETSTVVIGTVSDENIVGELFVSIIADTGIGKVNRMDVSDGKYDSSETSLKNDTDSSFVDVPAFLRR